MSKRLWLVVFILASLAFLVFLLYIFYGLKPVLIFTCLKVLKYGAIR